MTYSELAKKLEADRGLYMLLATLRMENEEQGVELLKEIRATDKLLKDIDAALPRSTSGGGNYQSTLGETYGSP